MNCNINIGNLAIFIPELIYKKILLHVERNEGEVGIWGETNITNNQIVVTDIFLIEQHTTPSHYVLDTNARSNFYYQYHQSGGDLGNLKLILHSHGDFSACWSPDDEKTIENYSRADYLVSIVVDRIGPGHILNRIDFFHPFRFTIHNIPIVILWEYLQDMIDQVDADIASKVHFSIPKPDKNTFDYLTEFFPIKGAINGKRKLLPTK